MKDPVGRVKDSVHEEAATVKVVIRVTSEEEKVATSAFLVTL